MMRVNGTLRECIDNGYSIRAYCPNGHHRALPLAQIAAQLGPDFPATRAALLPKLRCSRCDAMANAIICSPAARADGWPERIL